jgi:hypothetical protein
LGEGTLVDPRQMTEVEDLGQKQIFSMGEIPWLNPESNDESSPLLH